MITSSNKKTASGYHGPKVYKTMKSIKDFPITRSLYLQKTR